MIACHLARIEVEIGSDSQEHPALAWVEARRVPGAWLGLRRGSQELSLPPAASLLATTNDEPRQGGQMELKKHAEMYRFDEIPDDELFLIEKRGYWYRPKSSGYTSSMLEAGIYSKNEVGFCFDNDGKNRRNETTAVPLRHALQHSDFNMEGTLESIQERAAMLIEMRDQMAAPGGKNDPRSNAISTTQGR